MIKNRDMPGVFCKILGINYRDVIKAACREDPSLAVHVCDDLGWPSMSDFVDGLPIENFLGWLRQRWWEERKATEKP